MSKMSPLKKLHRLWLIAFAYLMLIYFGRIAFSVAYPDVYFYPEAEQLLMIAGLLAFVTVLVCPLMCLFMRSR